MRHLAAFVIADADLGGWHHNADRSVETFEGDGVHRHHRRRLGQAIAFLDVKARALFPFVGNNFLNSRAARPRYLERRAIDAGKGRRMQKTVNNTTLMKSTFL